jgi:hypothetical protein
MSHAESGRSCWTGILPIFEIGFGSDNNTRNVRRTAEIDDSIVEGLDHIERVAGGGRVDEDVAMDANGMLRVKYRVFILHNA